MEKFICFTGAFKDSGFPNRLVYQNKGSEKPAGAPPPEPEKKWEDMSFAERARARAREAMKKAEEALLSGARAVGEFHEGMTEAGADVIGGYVATGKKAARGAAEFHRGMTEAGADVIASYVERGKEAWKQAEPVAEVLVGLGLLAADKVAEWNRDVSKFTMAQLKRGINWVKFQHEYVKDGVLDATRLVMNFGKEKAALIAKFHREMTEAGADVIGGYVATGKKAARKGGEFIAQARTRGQEALGTGGGPVPPEEARTAIARAPKAAPGKAPRTAPRPVAPEGAGAVARPHDENLTPLVDLQGRVLNEELARLPETPAVIEYVVKDYTKGETSDGKPDNMWKILRKFYPRDQVNQALCDAIQESSLGTIARLPGGRKSLIVPGNVIKIPKTVTYRDRSGKEVIVTRNDEFQRNKRAELRALDRRQG